MPWYAVHIKPRQEDRVSASLTEHGLEVFLPKIEVRRKRRGAGTRQVEPLFPGYLFVAASLTADVWTTVRWTSGVRTILGCDGTPSPVPDESVALIRQHLGVAGIIQPEAAFDVGDRVRITDGPFAGLVGILERGATRSGRVRVLLGMLQGATIELEDVDLELAS
jgi:transcription elongation factor/antiterminator RfaH